MANETSKISIEIHGDSESLKKAAKAAERALNGLDKKAKQTTGKGGGMGMLQTAFRRLAAYGAAGIAINGVKRFASDSFRMAASLEGIERQFKLATSQGETSLGKLREATKGTVSDFELMKAAVRADTFGLPLRKMASLFEFATLRAAQTGDSVQYLTESIVLGLGRKSPLILDNLGITMVRLKEAMGGTIKSTTTSVDLMKAMIKVAEEDTKIIRLLGEDSLTTSQKIDKLNASIDSMKASLGKGIIQSDVGSDVSSTLSGLSDAVSSLSGQDNGFLKQLKIIALTLTGSSSAANEYGKAITGAKEQARQAAIATKEYTGWLNRAIPETAGVVNSTAELTSVLSKANPFMEAQKTSARDGGEAYKGLKNALNAWAVAQKEAIEGTRESRKELATLTDIKLKHGDALKNLSYQLKYNSKNTDEVKEKEKALVAVLIALEQAEVSSSKAIKEKASLLSMYSNQLDVLRKKIEGVKLAIELSDSKTMGDDPLGIKGLYKNVRKEMGLDKAPLSIQEQLKQGAVSTPTNPNEKEIIADWERKNEKLQEARGILQGLSQAFVSAASSGESFGDIIGSVLKRLAIQLASMAASAAIISLLFPAMIGGGSFGKNMGSLLGGQGGFAGNILGGIFGGASPSTSVASSAVGGMRSRGVSSSIDVNVTGQMRGNDIYLAGQRGNNLYGRRLG